MAGQQASHEDHDGQGTGRSQRRPAAVLRVSRTCKKWLVAAFMSVPKLLLDRLQRHAFSRMLRNFTDK